MVAAGRLERGPSMSLATAPSRVRRREDAPKDRILCEFCSAKCCQYVALPLDKPKTWEDFDNIRWYLAHQDVTVFVDEGTWYIMMHRACRHLQADNRCGIYHDRMQICREYHTDSCEFDEDYLYEKVFENDQQIWDYAEAVLGPGKVRERSGPVLSVVS